PRRPILTLFPYPTLFRSWRALVSEQKNAGEASCSLARHQSIYRSVDLRFDDRRESVPRPVQSRLHRAKVAIGDVSDLFIRLALEDRKSTRLNSSHRTISY